ncbi:MAG: hypothetical protein KIT14_14000 [bacterium]|nr:hypothetical protein [bacterium]MCW5891645.1 hypothetical protein [bacterium]
MPRDPHLRAALDTLTGATCTLPRPARQTLAEELRQARIALAKFDETTEDTTHAV